jgi:hypothetical protein
MSVQPSIKPPSKASSPVAAPLRKFAGAFRDWRIRSLPGQHVPRPPKPKTNFSMTLRTWHRRAGLFAFVFMGWLGFSGFLINQSADWGYDVARVRLSWVMALYGLHPEPPGTGLTAGGHWLAETLDATLLDGKPLKTRIPKQLGMAVGGTPEKPLLFVAEPDKVLILGPDGSLVDEMSGYTLPVPALRRIGVVEGKPSRVVIQDLDAYATTDGLQWDKLPVNSEVKWSEQQPLPEAQKAKAIPYSRPSVSLEHVLVDAHSGRIFGAFGAWVINFVGIAAILLSISGIWIVMRTNNQRRQARR